ncbi:hypothetical protein DL98DRAFT_599458 [Cadophora sp. DSE1049]|nr:hypothetical protein DL98DRAFT_599458 [Cadophora sp. DSE1049]
MSRMQQANGQQPAINGQQLNANQMGLGQPKPGQVPPPKQPQSAPNSGPQSHPEPTTGPANTANNRPNARPQPGGRNAAQHSSPAQPSKNLKLASSDDVVEVPNPNVQQPRPAPQQPQDATQTQQARQNLTQ